MRPLARLLLVLGAVGLGAYLYGASPRDVTLVYGVPPGAAAATLEVEIRRGAERVRQAELALPAAGGELRHAVRLRDGAYVLRWRLAGGPGARAGERTLDVSEDATVVVPIGP